MFTCLWCSEEGWRKTYLGDFLERKMEKRKGWDRGASWWLRGGGEDDGELAFGNLFPLSWFVDVWWWNISENLLLLIVDDDVFLKLCFLLLKTLFLSSWMLMLMMKLVLKLVGLDLWVFRLCDLLTGLQFGKLYFCSWTASLNYYAMASLCRFSGIWQTCSAGFCVCCSLITVWLACSLDRLWLCRLRVFCYSFGKLCIFSGFTNFAGLGDFVVWQT